MQFTQLASTFSPLQPDRRLPKNDMSIPDYQALMLPLLRRAAVREIRILDVEKELGDDFGLVLQNRAHWAKFYMNKAGLVSFPKRGSFVATDAGRELLARNPNQIDVNLLRQYPSFEEFYRGDHAEAVQASPAEVVPSA
jgi:restriction system protein